MLNEEEVYNSTKKILKKNDFIILGGQPPRGVDHLPVIEIKSGLNHGKGSKDSFKPDLVAFKDNIFYIIECKPVFNFGDHRKLCKILNSEKRILFFYLELNQRSILKKVSYSNSFEFFKHSIRGCLAYSGKFFSSNCLIHIVVENFLGKGKIIYPSR